jgi:hypothetical protein
MPQISGSPISYGPISGDIEEEAAQQGVYAGGWMSRRRIVRNRYPGMETQPPAPVSLPATPIYNSLSPEKRVAVDRLTAAVIFSQKQGGL